MRRIGAGRGVICRRGVSDGSEGARPLRRSHSARTELFFADEGQSFADDIGWGATRSNVKHVVSILERCAAKTIEWASRRGLQFDAAKMEAALFTHRRGHRKHLRPKLSAKIRVGSGSLRFNAQATCCLGVWMDAHLTFKEHHHRCMKKARAAEARL